MPLSRKASIVDVVLGLSNDVALHVAGGHDK